MGIVKPRHTLRTEILHLMEDAESEGRPIWVKTLVELTEKSETTIRKAVNELLAEGFIRRKAHAITQLETVRKQDLTDEPEEVKNMADATTTTETAETRGRPKDPAVKERDAKVLALIVKTKEGSTVEELTAQLDLPRNTVYLSVWRLSRSGQIAKTASGSRAPRWAKVAG